LHFVAVNTLLTRICSGFGHNPTISFIPSFQLQGKYSTCLENFKTYTIFVGSQSCVHLGFLPCFPRTSVFCCCQNVQNTLYSVFEMSKIIVVLLMTKFWLSYLCSLVVSTQPPSPFNSLSIKCCLPNKEQEEEVHWSLKQSRTPAVAQPEVGILAWESLYEKNCAAPSYQGIKIHFINFTHGCCPIYLVLFALVLKRDSHVAMKSEKNALISLMMGG
jgi:hypothetical protein